MPALRLLIALLLVLSLIACGGNNSRPAPEPPPEKPQPEEPEPQGLAAFVLPWDDNTGGITHMGERLNHTPAGKHGPLQVSEGHFSLNDERIRFWGVNITAESNFPSQEEAEGVAGRLAKFGVNLVRFHHMDHNWGGLGLIDYSQGDSLTLNEDALDRLDYFIHQLKEQGIYLNINLINAREFEPADGLPESITQLDWKERQVLGFFMEDMRDLEKDYARQLLRRENPYTGLTYAEDPAIAFVEINNENSLFQQYYDGSMDNWPDDIQQQLQAKWNQWLSARYEDTEAAEEAWGAIDEPLGEELLANGDFAQDTADWNLEDGQTHGSAARADARVGTHQDRQSVAVEVTQAGAEEWHVQFHQEGVAVEEDQLYTLSFWMNSADLEGISVNLQQAYDPWSSYETHQLDLTHEWQRFTTPLTGPATDDNLRINFSGLGNQEGTLYLANISLRPGGSMGHLPEGQNLEEQSIALNRHSGRYTSERRRDWMRFLRHQEQNYWSDMHRFVKEELEFNGLVTGTQLMNSPPSVQNEFPFIDAHAYWQHPIFPGTAWDSKNWIVHNRSMVNTMDNAIHSLAGQRLAGKPFTVSEYQHSSPNTYSSEGPLLIAAYAALQDWDGVYLFAYDAGGEGWGTDYVDNFFSMNAHPTKMANMALGANLFRRADVAPAHGQLRLNFTAQRELDILASEGSAWNVANASHLNPDPRLALSQRVALDLEGNGVEQPPTTDKAAQVFSDTQELLWDLSAEDQGRVIIDTATSKALVGFDQGRQEFNHGVALTLGDTRQNWATLGISLQEGRFDQPDAGGRLLIVATGLLENTDMQWLSEKQESLGHDWGTGPTLIEVVPATLELPYPADKVSAWALDEQGQRKQALEVRAHGNGSLLELGGDATLWYEVTADNF